MRSLTIRVVTVWVCVAALACGSKSPTNPSNSSSGSSSSGGTSGGGSNPPGTTATCNVPGNPATGTMTVTIDGVAWRAVCLGVTTTTPGVISFAGGEPVTQTTGTILAFAATRGVGTTSVGVLSPTNALLTVGAGVLWGAALNNGSGTLTIATLTANNAQGTFSFTLTPQAGNSATTNKVVTNGTFNVNF
jgi:hypothetical protein